MKLTEARFLDQEKENRRLEGYVNKTESRNHELQQTVRTFQRKPDLTGGLDRDRDRSDYPEHLGKKNFKIYLNHIL